MTKDRNSYKSIVKATSLFGGVKIFQIIISIIRSKIIAVLLGPNGMGISGLITTSTNMISSFVGLGLQTSAIRDVSQAYSSGNELRKNTIVTVLKKLIFITGILGTVITLFLSSYLSEVAFGNKDYTNAFRIVSIILLFNQLNIGNIVLLQGTFHYKEIAKSALFGNIIGLVLTVPLYYIWGIKAIVPAIIIASFIQFILSWIYARKVNYEKVSLTTKQLFSEGKAMLTMGIVIAATGFAYTGKTYVLKIIISNFGAIADVGLYTAGIAIANTYVGLVLNSMTKDYAPRLAAIANKKDELIEVINKQAIFLITVLAPLIIAFIVFIKEVIIILYSDKFIAITGMIEWVMLGMFFRAISWSISFSFVARGDSKLFFWNELLLNIYSLANSVIAYLIFGITGLGLSFLVTYLIYTLHMYILSRKVFSFKFNKEFIRIFIPELMLCLFGFIVIKIIGYNAYRYIFGIIILSVTIWISYKNLDKMIDIKSIISKIKQKILSSSK